MKKNFAQKTPNVNQLLGYTLPALYTGKDWFVAFNAYDPISGKMRRKRYRLNAIKKIGDRRKRAQDLIMILIGKLEEGWNPFIQVESNKQYTLWADVYRRYEDYVTKLYNDGNLREKTWYGYKSMLKTLVEWNDNRYKSIHYAFQFNRDFICSFLDYIYIDRGCSIRTRNNYLIWIKTFESYLLQHSYISAKVTDEIPAIRNNKADKNRRVISDNDMYRLLDFLEAENRHYLLACYMIYYLMIRPKEMSYIRVGDINLKKQTVFISGVISKNRKDGVVTLPARVARLMIDLHVFDNPGGDYLFSKGFKPGSEYVSEKSFRDYWDRTVRKRLNYPKEYKFYSLKDTGITNMLRKYDTLSVRDQARHSSLIITDVYTPQGNRDANPKLKNYEGIL